MNPAAELAWIAEAFGESYGTSFAKPPPDLLRRHQPIVLEVAQVRGELQQMPLRKAARLSPPMQSQQQSGGHVWTRS